jgi:hypothetical protein
MMLVGVGTDSVEMEDVDMVRRIGRRNLVELPATATTSAARYRRDGYWNEHSEDVKFQMLKED